MMALIFMSAGGSLPFAQKGVVEHRILPFTVTLTVVGSTLGAFLLLSIPTKALQLTIAIAMVTVAAFSLTRPSRGESQQVASSMGRLGGYATFLLAIYGGFFSGGYVTMLTVVFVLLFGLTFLQAMATTKVINLFSSLVATVIFALSGAVDYKLGLVLGVSMFLGSVVGGNVAVRRPTPWLRRAFLIAVVGLSLRMLFEFTH